MAGLVVIVATVAAEPKEPVAVEADVKVVVGMAAAVAAVAGTAAAMAPMDPGLTQEPDLTAVQEVQSVVYMGTAVTVGRRSLTYQAPSCTL